MKENWAHAHTHLTYTYKMTLQIYKQVVLCVSMYAHYFPFHIKFQGNWPPRSLSKQLQMWALDPQPPSFSISINYWPFCRAFLFHCSPSPISLDDSLGAPITDLASESIFQSKTWVLEQLLKSIEATESYQVFSYLGITSLSLSFCICLESAHITNSHRVSNALTT